MLTLTLYFGGAIGHADGLGADLDQIEPPRQHLVLAHPDDRRLELVGDAGRRIGGRQHVAAADVDLVARASP